MERVKINWSMALFNNCHLPFKQKMLTKLFERCTMIHFPRNLKYILTSERVLLILNMIRNTHLGHGVILEKRSSAARDIPRTTRQLPRPFHSVVTPCRRCKCTIAGTRVNGKRWYLQNNRIIINSISNARYLSATPCQPIKYIPGRAMMYLTLPAQHQKRMAQ